ncbi:LysM domain protein [Ancylostoma duodenale]|uniref:LysM domain protein n=1 Tax=Ancylostoma duodenale TaxID=51022 RepID=A0A0C2CEX5_9BILA|nr:LysM domain protein [Ancylostoma duodenale]
MLTDTASNTLEFFPIFSWYRIQSGDYCYKIWADNGLTEQQLLALNPGLNCNALNIGDRLDKKDSLGRAKSSYPITLRIRDNLEKLFL